MKWLQTHVAVLCIVIGSILTLFVIISWGIGYYCNALYGMHFQIDSCWTGLNAIALSLVGFLKWVIDSWKNSSEAQLPEGYKGVSQNSGENKI